MSSYSSVCGNRTFGTNLAVACVVAVLAPLAWAQGVPCTVRARLSTFDLTPHSMHTQGSMVFACEWMTIAELEIIDASDPLHPQILGRADINFPAEAMRVSGAKLYLAHSALGMSIVDISDPANPVNIGNYDDTEGTFFFANSIELYGPCAYYSDDTSNLRVLDVTDSTNPTLVRNYSCVSSIQALMIRQDTLCVGTSDDFQLLDVSTPTDPTLVGSVPLSSSCVDFDFLGDLACVAEFDGTVEVIDISTPSSPIVLGSLMLSPGPNDVQNINGTILIATDHDGIAAIDLSSRTAPTVAAIYGSFNCYQIQPLNGLMVAGEGSEISFIDPAEMVDYERARAGSGHAPRAVAAESNRVYTLTEDSRLTAYDIHDIGNPVELGSVPLSGINQIAHNGIACVAAGSNGLAIVDFRVPSVPRIMYQGIAFGSASDVAIKDGVLLATRTTRTLLSINIDDPVNPVLLNTLLLPAGNPKAIDVVGNRAVVGTSEGIVVVDVTSAISPQVLGSLDTPDAIADVRLVGDRVFAAGRKFYAFDISDPTSPIQLSRTSYYSNSIEVFGSYALLSSSSSYDLGHTLWDVSDPLQPVEVAQCEANDDCQGMAAMGSLAIVTRGVDGWSIYDLSDCPPCPADSNADGLLDFFDVQAFLGAFAAQDPAGDFNADGNFDFYDVQSYLNAYSAGCP